MALWEFTVNKIGWGPPATFCCKESENMPVSVFCKPDRPGRFYDFYENSAAKQILAKKAEKDDDDNGGFTIVESKAAIKAKKKGTSMPRKNIAPQSQQFRPVDTKTGKPVKQYRNPNQQVFVPRVLREASISLGKEWEMVTEFNRQKLEKQNYIPGKGKEILRTGTICQYDDRFDRAGPRNSVHLSRCEKVGLVNWITTVEPQFANIVKTREDINVIASDAVIALLMTCPLSVYPWDIAVRKIEGKLVLDYDEKKIFDYTTVYESAIIPPEEDTKRKALSVNGPKKLSIEATMTNHYFGQQALIPGTDIPLGEESKITCAEEKERPKKGFVYKVWKLDKDIKLCVRSQIDAYIKIMKSEEKLKREAEEAEENKKQEKKKESKEISIVAKRAIDTEEKDQTEEQKEEVQEEDVQVEEEKSLGPDQYFINLKAVNEYYEGKRQMNWKQGMEKNRGFITSEVSTNDSLKLTRWAIQAILGGVDHVRIAYIIRKKVDDTKDHDIINVQRFTTEELKRTINLNTGYAWGILRVIIKTLMEQEDGHYYLVKDPNRFIIRLYKKVELPKEEDKEFVNN